MIRTIIFDFGNVVGFFDHRRTLQRLAPYSNISTEEIFERVYLGEMEELFEAGHMTVPEFCRRLRRECSLTCDDAFLKSAFADIFWPNPEICNLVPRLKGQFRLLLGSNTNELHANHFLNQFADTLAHFDELILSHRVRARKPHGAFFANCLEQAACSPQECLFVDDLPANIAGARASGMMGIVYSPQDNCLGQMRALGIAL